MATLQDYLGITKLRDAWPKWKANIIAVNNQVIAHVAGTADKHAAGDVTYDPTGNTKLTGATIQVALDQAETEFANVIAGDANAEVGDAHESTVKAKTFTDIRDRFEEIEQDHVTDLADNVQQFADIDANILALETEKADQTDLDTTNATVALKADKTYVDAQNTALTRSVIATYETVAALETALPTGDVGNYVVATDGHVYTWNGSAWTDTGIQYQSTGIASKSVTYDKTDFIDIGNNFFNPYITTDGYRLTTAGAPYADELYTLSDYIPINIGIAYILNNLGTTVNRVCQYDLNKVFVQTLSGTITTNLEFTASANGFIRIPVLITGKDKISFSVKSVQPTFIPFEIFTKQYLKAIPQNNSVEKDMLKDGEVTPDKTSFLVKSINLFNKATRVFEYLLGSGNIPGGLYNTSDYIEMKNGITYTISNCRKYETYDTFKINNILVDNITNQSATFTATRDGYLRVSYAKTYEDILQVEVGDTVTEYVSYDSISFPNLNLENDSIGIEKLNQFLKDKINNGDLTIVKSGEVFEISSNLGDDTLIVKTTRNGSLNGSFSFNESRLNSDVIHANGDDITPIRTFTTVGANHGYPNIVIITIASHGKTTADLGSKWTDGVTEYTLLAVSGDDLTFGCPYTVTDSVVSSSAVNPVANLTHVSGATNTALVDVTTKDSSPRLYPSTNNKSVKYILDGNEITVDGTYYGKELQVQENYNVMCYKEIIDYAQSHIGTSYANDNVGGAVKLSITYTFTKGCNCHISHTFKALKKVTILNCGFIQSFPMSFSGHKIYRYMPNVLPKSGIDFKTLVDMSTYNQSLVFGVVDYINASTPPNRHIDWLKDSLTGVKKIGFTMGYLTDKTNSKNADRLINTTNGWDMRDTTKSYPIAMSGLTLNANEYKTFMAYRCYLPTQEATNINIVKDKKDTYVFIDYHSTINAKTIAIDNCIGKSVTVLDSNNFTLHNDIVDSEGITFSISNSYGYAILKVS